ncbi:cytochrome P450 [Cunninghamella echinulata]|nr:cytochrome P450 [Cunninghamella echinulata]
MKSPAGRKQLLNLISTQGSLLVKTPAFKRAVVRFLLKLTLIYIVSKYFVYRLFLHPANKLPGPPPDLFAPFLGNIRQILSTDAGVIHRQWANKYGRVFRYFAGGNHPRILITEHELVKQVLTTEEFEFIKPPETKQFLSLFLGNGILVTEGNIHRYQRKMLNPAFGLSALREMVPSMITPTLQLIELWQQKCSSSRPVEIIVSKDLGLLTLDIINSSGFGIQTNCVKDPYSSPLSRAYMDLLAGDDPIASMIAMMFPWVHKLPIKRARQVKKDMILLKEEAGRMVKEAAQRSDLHEKKDLLALMMRQVDDETGKMLTPKELQDQCLTFLAAGHETTSTSLSWTLHTLAHHQEIQDELREEVQLLFGGDMNDFPTYEEINQLHLLNNVCKESMRYTPPVPFTNRISTKEFEFHGKKFPQGTRVVLAPIVSHFDKELWGNDADAFIPSRWDHAPANNISPYVYMPFLNGGRQCIGYRFAILEFKITLAILICNFKFSPKPGFKVRKGIQITLRPLPNMTLMVEKV